MALNENTIKGKWLEIRGEVRKMWGKLTDDELDKTKGDLKQIGGLIQQKYGSAQADYQKKLDAIYSRFETKKEDIVKDVKSTIQP